MPIERGRDNDVVSEVAEWGLCFSGRPWSLNQERTQHWSIRNERTETWRHGFWALAVQAGIPPMRSIEVVAQPYLKGRLQDAGNCYPAVKAAIDGLVDAKVIPDDDPKYLRAVTFMAPERVSTTECLVLTVRGCPAR